MDKTEKALEIAMVMATMAMWLSIIRVMIDIFGG